MRNPARVAPVVATPLLLLAATCAPASDKTAPVARSPATTGAAPAPGPPAARASAPSPPPVQNSFPANPWNERRFERFRQLEPVDEDWAPIVERQLRSALEAESSPRARVMHVECRTDTCVVGLIAWQAPGIAWPPWPNVPWSGSSGGKIEPRPDGWSELVLVLHRNARDRSSSEPRVPSFASPQEDPDCRTALPNARPNGNPRDPSCRYVTGFAHNKLCFDLAQQACACACGRAGTGPGCRLRGRGLECIVSRDPRRSVFFEYIQ